MIVLRRMYISKQQKELTTEKFFDSFFLPRLTAVQRNVSERTEDDSISVSHIAIFFVYIFIVPYHFQEFLLPSMVLIVSSVEVIRIFVVSHTREE